MSNVHQLRPTLTRFVRSEQQVTAFKADVRETQLKGLVGHMARLERSTNSAGKRSA